MWITAWLLVGSAALNQPNLPPFATRADCDAARKIYVRSRAESAAECVEAKIFIGTPR